MHRTLVFWASLSLAVSMWLNSQAAISQPLKVLILTSPGVYHNYEQQTQDLAKGIAEQVNVQFDVSLAELNRWRTTDFARGYDALIYNICMADSRDDDLINNLRRQTEQLKVPALVIHCTMHSFRETNLWWPMFGLQTRAHESLRPLTQIQEAKHPILDGIPDDWTVANDELYINLQFEGQRLLSATGEDTQPHTTAWLAYRGSTPVFGTTLGHSEETLKDPAFQRLIANALLFVTGNLSDQGAMAATLEPVGGRIEVIENVFAPQGVKFLGQAGMDCAFRHFAKAAGPCYLACIVNPLEWGEATQTCKRSCEVKLPSADKIISICAPGS